MLDPKVSPSPTLSLEESIQCLKAEILSQDWRLSQKRAELLAAAFRCLKQRFTNRKNAFAIIVMANNVLLYIKKKGDQQVPGTVDFLKEAMAHIVILYECPAFDPDQDKKIFNALYRRFNLLKEKIQSDRQPCAKEQSISADLNRRETEQLLQQAAAQCMALHQTQRNTEEIIGQLPGTSGHSPQSRPAFQKASGENVEKLVRELKDSLRQTEQVSSTIRQIIVELLADRGASAISNAATSSINPEEPIKDRHPLPSASKGEMPALPSASSQASHTQLPEACEETDILLIEMGMATIALEKCFLAARRLIPPNRRKYYLKNNAVPLKDFKRPFQSLAGQFKGFLSTLKGSILRTLSLPVIIPRGLNLPDKPGEKEQETLVLCSGNWCGILLCSPAEKPNAVMVGRKQLNNGDLYQTAYTEDGQEFPLLNSVEILKREGHLVVGP